MTLRTRLFALVGAVVALTDVLVTTTVASSARRAFAAVDDQRTAVLVTQVRREFAAEGDQVAQRLERAASSDEVTRMAADLGRSRADVAAYVGAAAPLAASQGLDFLDIVSDAGTIISSAHAPARFGYRHPWLRPGTTAMPDSEGAYLQRVELASEVALGLVAARGVAAGDRRLVLVGGRRLDERFLKALVLPAGHARPAVSRRRDRNHAPASRRRVGSRRRESAVRAVDRARAPEPPGCAGANRLAGRHRIGCGDSAAGPRTACFVASSSSASSGRELSALVNRIRWSGVAVRCARSRRRMRPQLRRGGARDAPGRRARRCRARRRGRSMGRAGDRERVGERDGRARACLSNHDGTTGRSARAPRAGRACGGLARAGAPPRARAEESAVPAADHGRQPAAREVAHSVRVRRGVRGEHGHADDRAGQSQHGHRTVQRLRPHAGARDRRRVAQRRRAAGGEAVSARSFERAIGRRFA